MARVLSEVEEVAVRSLFAQCVKNCGGIFVHDGMATLEHAFSAGIVSKKGLGIVELAEIIENLTNEGIIKTDRIVDADYLKTYYKTHFPGQQPPIKPGAKFYWLHNTDWAYKKLQYGGLIGIDEVQKKYGCVMFINMTIEEDMPNIEEKYLASHMAYLKLDKEKCCLCIRFDKEKSWRELKPHMNPEASTFKILCTAYKNANKDVTTKALGMEGKNLENGVFVSTTNVKALNPILIELKKDSIKFKTFAKVTPEQFESLKRDLGLS